MPVERARRHPGKQCARARCDEPRPAGTSSRDEQEEECGDKERESDQPELRERLHIEGVSVAHDEQVRALLVPQVLERASSVAGEWLVAACIPGKAKLLAPPISGDAEKALVQVDIADGPGRESVLELRDRRSRAARTAQR